MQNRKTIGFSIALMGLFLMVGCNTIQGIGKDIQSAGEGLERGADNIRNGGDKDDKDEETGS